MTKNHEVSYVCVYTVCGHLAGDIIRLLLESAGIPVVIRQESAGVALGLTVGSLGIANICVPENRVEEAARLLEEMDQGSLENAIPNFEEKMELDTEEGNGMGDQ